jgi:toxin FitB
MIVLDTNVISEFMKESPAPQVVAWADAQDAGALWISAITATELYLGVERLPEGRRKRQLLETVTRWIDDILERRVLSYDLEAARFSAELFHRRKRQGRPVGIADMQIAAIALAHGATLATRNVADFEDTGISLINPWDAPST